eukprot:5822562-Prymnesium_polylepis.1
MLLGNSIRREVSITPCTGQVHLKTTTITVCWHLTRVACRLCSRGMVALSLGKYSANSQRFEPLCDSDVAPGGWGPPGGM